MKIADGLKVALVIEGAREAIEEAQVGDSVPLPSVPLRIYGKRISLELVAVVKAYLMPLDDDMREKIAPLAKPYPKRERGVDSDTPGVQPGEGGAHPTRSLSDSGPSRQAERTERMTGVNDGCHATG